MFICTTIVKEPKMLQIFTWPVIGGQRYNIRLLNPNVKSAIGAPIYDKSFIVLIPSYGAS